MENQNQSEAVVKAPREKVFFLHTDQFETNPDYKSPGKLMGRRPLKPYEKQSRAYRVSIAGILSEDQMMLRVSSSICAPGDQFSKKHGRKVSVSRANADRAYKHAVTDASGKGITEILASYAAKVVDRIKKGEHPYWYS